MCALPKPVRPEYSTTIPSTGKKIKYQPFSVREEKILVLAAESSDIDEISNAIANVLNNCITTEGVDVNNLALFDIEFLFLKARAKSIGEKLTLNVTDPDDETYTVEHEVNIDSIKVLKNKDHSDLVQINDTTSVKMKYPDLSFFAEGVKIQNLDASTEQVARCIGSIVIDEEVYTAADMEVSEVTEWLDGLTATDFSKVMNFFETMPRLSHTIKLTNKKNGKPFEIVLEGLADFF